MKTSGIWLSLAICCGISDLAAADLKIERTIAKEPAYQSSPRYCLLAFGYEADTPVWIVVDGDVLYVDRNANGDLTEKNERWQIPKFRAAGLASYAEQREINVGQVHAGHITHHGLTIMQRRVSPDLVAKTPDERALLPAASAEVTW